MLLPMTSSRSTRISLCGALIVLVAALTLLVTGCREAEDSTTTAAVIEPTTTTAGEETTTTTSAPERPTTTTTARPVHEEFVFGMLLAGPYDDRGWSQSNHEGGLYVQSRLPGARMIYLDRVNPTDRPDATPDRLAGRLVNRGADMIFFTSDDMSSGAYTFAREHPSIPVVHTSGDGAWKDGRDYQNLPNLTNIMGRMEYGKMIAGVAAALTTRTGAIGYLGPLINDQTRRLAAAAYLGARYAWTEYLKRDPADLKFSVRWIGDWFHTPGVTTDPARVAGDFFDEGFDVVISGIDTTEALIQANRLSTPDRPLWAVPYNFTGSLNEAPAVALGVPYFNWGPAYLDFVVAARIGQWRGTWEWRAPYPLDINDRHMSTVGFLKGGGLPVAAAAKVDDFTAALAEGLNLWTGPLNLQDGTPYLADGEVATDPQIWYLPQLLEGMAGQSVSK